MSINNRVNEKKLFSSQLNQTTALNFLASYIGGLKVKVAQKQSVRCTVAINVGNFLQWHQYHAIHLKKSSFKTSNKAKRFSCKHASTLVDPSSATFPVSYLTIENWSIARSTSYSTFDILSKKKWHFSTRRRIILALKCKRASVSHCAFFQQITSWVVRALSRTILNGFKDPRK